MKNQTNNFCFKGMELIQQNNYGEALQWQIFAIQLAHSFNQAVALDENNQYAWFPKGTCEFQLGQYEKAVESLKKTILVEPKNYLAYYFKGNALNYLGRHEEALKDLNQCIQLDYKDIEVWNAKGAVLNELGRYEEALQAFNQCIQLDHKYIEAWNNKGNVLGDLGRYEESLQAFNQCIQLDYKDIEAWNNKGNVLNNLGRYEEAFYNQCIQLDYKYTYAWNGKGNVLRNLGRYKEALQVFNQCIQLDYKYTGPWNGKGVILNHLGRYEEALQAFNQCIQLDYKCTGAWNGKGVVLNNLGRYEESFQAFDKAIKIAPEDFYFTNKAQLMEKLNRVQDAIECYKNALDLNSNNQFAKDKILYYGLSISSLGNIHSQSLQIKNQIKDFIIQKGDEDTDQVYSIIVIVLQIWSEFCIKLSQNYSVFWIEALIQTYDKRAQEVCSYIAKIEKYLLTIKEAKNIQITHHNAAKGGQGQIHYGINYNDQVAIKEQYFQDSEIEKIIALLKEMAIMCYCEHKNIAKILSIYFDTKDALVWIIQPKYFITLEAALIQRIKYSKKNVCLQILYALQYLHNVGLIHMDLKPNNIMFTTQELKDIVLLDFGISNVYKKNEGTKIFGMTPFYCPPEIRYHDLLYVTPKADIFSFGIILYEVAAEKDAFPRFISNTSSSEIYNYIRSKDFDFFAENQATNNKDLDELIRNCTHSDINVRPTATEALKTIKRIEFN